MMRTTLNVGDHCVSCLCDTSWPDGRWMNLIGGDTEYYFGALCILVDGDWCEECQTIECDGCENILYGDMVEITHSKLGVLCFHPDCTPDQADYEGFFTEGV